MRLCIVSLLVCLPCMVVCVPIKSPVEGMEAQFVHLPEAPEADEAFLTPTLPSPVPLPKEPTYLFISVAHTTKVILYHYMADDKIYDLFKYVAERSSTSVSDIEKMYMIKFQSVGRTTMDIPFSFSQTLRDVPLVAGDEIEVMFKENIDTKALTISPNPSASYSGSIPGFFDVKVKVTGLPLLTLPIPRLVKGKVVTTIVEDRCGLNTYSVELRREVRDGPVFGEDEILTDTDKFLWGTLEMKGGDPYVPITDGGNCTTGQLTILTNLGKSHYYQFSCNTTAKDIVLAMDNFGLLPEPETTPGNGLFVSTKGFFHEKTIDTLDDTDLIVDAGAQNNGMVFITIACPVTMVYFSYHDSTFPQYINCTTTTEYMDRVFTGLSIYKDAHPKYFFINQGVRTEIKGGSSIARQLGNITAPIIEIDFVPKESESPSPSLLPSTSPVPSPSSPPPPPPTPSPVALSKSNWDSQDDRESDAPEGAEAIGDESLIQHRGKWSEREEMAKYKSSEQ